VDHTVSEVDFFAETGLTCNKHPMNGTEWKDMSPQNQEIYRERRTFAEKLLSDISGIPYASNLQTYIGTINTTQASQQADVADELAVRGRGKRSHGGRDRTNPNQVCRQMFCTFHRNMTQHKSLERIGPLDTNPIARSPQSDDYLEEERIPRPPAKRARRERAGTMPMKMTMMKTKMKTRIWRTPHQ
jgi:hypothetical protein